MAKKKSATDGAEDFQASGPFVQTPPKPGEITADPATWPEPKPKAEDKPKFDPAAGQKTVYLSAEDLRDTFAAQSRAAAEHHLRQLALAHPEVKALLDELTTLRAKVAELEAK